MTPLELFLMSPEPRASRTITLDDPMDIPCPLATVSESRLPCSLPITPIEQLELGLSRVTVHDPPPGPVSVRKHVHKVCYSHRQWEYLHQTVPRRRFHRPPVLRVSLQAPQMRLSTFLRNAEGPVDLGLLLQQLLVLSPRDPTPGKEPALPSNAVLTLVGISNHRLSRPVWPVQYRRRLNRLRVFIRLLLQPMSVRLLYRHRRVQLRNRRKRPRVVTAHRLRHPVSAAIPRAQLATDMATQYAQSPAARHLSMSLATYSKAPGLVPRLTVPRLQVVLCNNAPSLTWVPVVVAYAVLCQNSPKLSCQTCYSIACSLCSMPWTVRVCRQLAMSLATKSTTLPTTFNPHLMQ
jgi:hypothetical protein